MIEALNSVENGPCLLTTTAAAARFIARAGRDNIRLQYDAYHMQRMEGDLTATVDAYWELISHIQVADVPGRGEPGTGEINYRFLLGHLDARGYDGYIGLEYRPSSGRPEESIRLAGPLRLAPGLAGPAERPCAARTGTGSPRGWPCSRCGGSPAGVAHQRDILAASS